MAVHLAKNITLQNWKSLLRSGRVKITNPVLREAIVEEAISKAISFPDDTYSHARHVLRYLKDLANVELLNVLNQQMVAQLAQYLRPSDWKPYLDSEQIIDPDLRTYLQNLK